jgi:hypothetical protein
MHVQGSPAKAGEETSRGSPTSFVTASWIIDIQSLSSLQRIARGIAGFADLDFFAAEKMLQNKNLSTPWWPVTLPQFHLLTAPSNQRSSSQTAFHHSYLEHVRVVQMFTLVCITLHQYYSNILFLDPDSNRLMFTASSSRLTALFSNYS